MASEVRLQLDGIDGDSDEKWIDLEAWGTGVSGQYTITGKTSDRGKANFEDLNFQKQVDSSSVTIFQRACDGKEIAKGKIHFLRAVQEDEYDWYYEVELENIRITSYSLNGTGDGVMENFTLRPNKIFWRYRPSKEDGTLDSAKPGQWNLITNKKE